jgi:hypothetical protein
MPSAVARRSAAATISNTPMFGPIAVRTSVTSSTDAPASSAVSSFSAMSRSLSRCSSVVCGGFVAMGCSWLVNAQRSSCTLAGIRASRGSRTRDGRSDASI